MWFLLLLFLHTGATCPGWVANLAFLKTKILNVLIIWLPLWAVNSVSWAVGWTKLLPGWSWGAGPVWRFGCCHCWHHRFICSLLLCLGKEPWLWLLKVAFVSWHKGETRDMRWLFFQLCGMSGQPWPAQGEHQPSLALSLLWSRDFKISREFTVWVMINLCFLAHEELTFTGLLFISEFYVERICSGRAGSELSCADSAVDCGALRLCKAGLCALV